VASAPCAGPVLSRTKEKKVDYKVVLIKPIKEDDTRNNEEIKTIVKGKLMDVRNKLKIREIKQMRKKG